MLKDKPDISYKEIEDLIADIKSQKRDVINMLYHSNFKKVEAYILKNSGDEESAKDTYHQSFVVLWRKIKLNQFTPKSLSDINAYLYRIARNKWIDFLRSSQRKNANLSVEIKDEIISADAPEETDEKIDQRLDIAKAAFDKLDVSCRNLLTRFYFDKKSMKEIALELNLDDASTRNKKYRCMQKLRTIAFDLERKQRVIGNG